MNIIIFFRGFVLSQGLTPRSVLPIRYFFEPLLNEADRETTKKVLSKKISVEQFHRQERLMGVAVNLVNSFAFGLLIHAIIIIFNRKPKHDKQRDLTRKKPSAV